MIIKKITNGYVAQSFNTETQLWTAQEFFAGEQVDYEVEGCGINVTDFEERVTSGPAYLPFDMVQPVEQNSFDASAATYDPLESLDDTEHESRVSLDGDFTPEQ